LLRTVRIDGGQGLDDPRRPQREDRIDRRHVGHFRIGDAGGCDGWLLLR